VLLNILLWLLIGAVAGWLAGIIMRSGGSLVRNIVLGIIGAIVGGFVVRLFGISIDAFSTWGLVAAVAGACLIIFLFRLFFGGKRR